MKFERLILLVLFSMLSGVPAYHKLVGDFPPEWFIKKFEPSFFGWIPYGLSLAFGMILLLEVVIPVIFIIALIKKEWRKSSELLYSRLGLRLSLVLFLILFFGSFLIQDYNNGFIDFMYFIGTLLILKFFFEPSRDT